MRQHSVAGWNLNKTGRARRTHSRRRCNTQLVGRILPAPAGVLPQQRRRRPWPPRAEVEPAGCL
eukprot:3621990-Alexandrium_andersonii.AAC.1